MPHQYPPDTALFLTWHLHGSLPVNLYPPPDNKSSGEAFVWMDRHLDATRNGPLFLRRTEIAELVEGAILRGGAELGHYELDAYVLMANHVHMLVDPRTDPSRFMKSLKGYTARMANRILGRSGAFWQAESYDHWVRNEAERERIRAYIENNPVTARLAKRPEDYRWSSAYRGAEP